MGKAVERRRRHPRPGCAVRRLQGRDEPKSLLLSNYLFTLAVEGLMSRWMGTAQRVGSSKSDKMIFRINSYRETRKD